MNPTTDPPSDKAVVEQPRNPRAVTHSDWWKRVPSCLTSPLLRWHGPPPSGSDDPAWPDYQRVCVESDISVRAELAEHFRVTGTPGTSEYDRTMLIELLALFPAYSAQRETRGAKQKPDADPESISRRKRRASRKADK